MNFLDYFHIESGLYSIVVGTSFKGVEYYPADRLPTLPNDRDVFFGPAMRRSPGDTKEDVLGSCLLWVDIDTQQWPMYTFPPTYVVNSGHGWHLYWALKEPVLDIEELERANKILVADIPTADGACWNANRFMRVPETVNTKDPDKPVKVVLHRTNAVNYSLSDFWVLSKIDAKTKHKIRTGDRRGYKSRSERDWAVVVALLDAGATEELIVDIFNNQPVGDKVRDPETNSGYLDRTIAEASNRQTKVNAKQGGFEEREDGYYDYDRRAVRRISTFVINPRLLLDATGFGGEDAIMGDVTAMGHTWSGVTFSRQAFTSVPKIDRECPIAAWQWLGRDEHVRRLLPHLMERLKDAGMPRVQATPALGLYQINDQWYFVGSNQTLSATGMWGRFDGPITALPTGRERPCTDFTYEANAEMVSYVARTLPLLNEPEVIWPLIGWFFATPLKPWLESRGYRFPILNVSGTKGSGKTTLIQRVFMPLLGQEEPKSYDAGTTRFVTLALLGGANAVPVAFSEFRYASVAGFLRYVLLSYDTGHDPRGRADQTTQDYPLTAPFSLDGEDLVADPAAQERIVAVQMHPDAVKEGGIAYESFNQWRGVDTRGFRRHFIQHTLRGLIEGDCDEALQRSVACSFRTFPGRLPDRIRNNLVVAYLGITRFCDSTGLGTPSFDVLRRSLGLVHNPDTGRSRSMVDDFVEALINDIVINAGTYFSWYAADSGVQVWFQLSSAHTWWTGHLRKLGKLGLEREAIRAQLAEADYILQPQKLGGCFLYGIDLAKAQAAGLDVVGRVAHGRSLA